MIDILNYFQNKTIAGGSYDGQNRLVAGNVTLFPNQTAKNANSEPKIDYKLAGKDGNRIIWSPKAR